MVADLCGAHAQLMSAPELSLWARVSHLRPQDVRDALWERRTPVKTWGMRGTLHLFSADEFPLYAAALSTRVGYTRNVWLKYFGLTLGQVEAVIEAIGAALSDRPVSRQDLADAVAHHAGSKMRAKMLSGWGTMLKPAASRGALVFGPSRGQNVTFVRPDRWLRRWRTLEPEGAIRRVMLRYLEAYGPATHDDCARWWGIDPGPARRLMASLEAQLEGVQVDGRRAWMRAGQSRRIRGMTPPEGVRLLPNFDPYVIAYRPREDLGRAPLRRAHLPPAGLGLAGAARRRPRRGGVGAEPPGEPDRGDRGALRPPAPRREADRGSRGRAAG